ncbi:MAG: helix-turn-helix domain-containing protein [Lachnospiraceae bacterium]|nr:helix-turn-helix domain-containing protein [Lachnospiraceae bacterium]
MISYEPFWTTLQTKNITKYQLIYHWGLSSNTLRRMSHGEPISTTTLNELCLILNCNASDILQFQATDEELQDITIRREEIMSRKKRRKSAPTKA